MALIRDPKKGDKPHHLVSSDQPQRLKISHLTIPFDIWAKLTHKLDFLIYLLRINYEAHTSAIPLKTLNSEPKTDNTADVQHVAIIMDGNGRWANRRGLPRNEGHRKGVENVEKIVEKAGQLGIQYLTLYAFSAENWSRPKPEVDALMSLLESFLTKQKEHLLENKIRLHTIGRINELPPSVYQLLTDVKMESSGFKDNHLILALNYGARNEILDAVKRYSKAIDEGTESIENLQWNSFNRYLDTAGIPDPELVIRTSGEHRLSNFLLMQSAYSEYYFSPVCWPDFGPDLLEEALQDYRSRERRFGKTGEQIRQAQSPTYNTSTS